jgi:transcriptional regulator with XRE-family HTH domain
MDDPFDGLPIALRAVRLRAGWTQKRWAEECGIHPALVSKYEKGVISPSLATLGRLLSVIGCSLRELDDALHAARRMPIPQDDEPGGEAEKLSDEKILDTLARLLAERLRDKGE